MKNAILRLEGLEIQNFKNVKYGSLNFVNPRKQYDASILGLYGQNGSGKTALIDALSLLKLALSGQTVPASLADFVNIDSDAATLKYSFKITHMDTKTSYSAIYRLSLRREADSSLPHEDDLNGADEPFRAVIFDEVLSYTCECESGLPRVFPVIDTRNSEVFEPKTKLDALTDGNKAAVTDLIVAKKLAAATSKSFIFSRDFMSVVRENCKDEHHRFILRSLELFGRMELFVINTSNAGLISMGALPLAFKYEEKNTTSFGNMALPLNGATTIPQEAFATAEKVIEDMNVVLKKIIPGLTIGVNHLGQQLMKNGKMGVRVQLVSHKNHKELPLQFESEGIKKIISILHLLIGVYNKSSITVAIDELDSGVFEYLLGELLRIISEKGKGQLIFTSHNLRPLETLDRGFIAFTTTNPANRYIRLSNVKNNNNLRDFYYRDIVLGEQSEEVYEPTNNYEIAFAFREAGESSGS